MNRNKILNIAIYILVALILFFGIRMLFSIKEESSGNDYIYEDYQLWSSIEEKNMVD